MTYRQADIIRAVRELWAQYDAMDPSGRKLDGEGERIAATLRDRFPGLEDKTLAAALRAYADERKWEHEQSQQELKEKLAAAQDAIDFYKRHDIPGDTPFLEAVRIVAERGNPDAQARYARMTSPLQRMNEELLDAAVDAHPAWSRDGEYMVFDSNIGGPSEAHTLIDWYQRTHPGDASAIEAKYSGGASP